MVHTVSQKRNGRSPELQSYMSSSKSIVLVLFFVAAVIAGDDDPKNPTFTRRKKAGPAFVMQGEYKGKLGKDIWGAQVVATGLTTFKAIGYPGGLPGDGAKGEKSEYVTGKLDVDSVLMKADSFSIAVNGKQLSVLGPDGNQLGRLEKVIRKSNTLGEKPPPEATVLFDGSNIDQWVNAKQVGKNLAATNCSTKQKFGDHRLHLEFRIPFTPESTGQARGNSGVYLQSRYEIQILDSFGEQEKDKACGSIYRIKAPKTNMCYPPLNWQTFDVEFTAARWEDDKKVANARVTVRHNGTIIHDDLELPTHTPGPLSEGPSPAPLFLQNGGNPVIFRNIWVVAQ